MWSLFNIVTLAVSAITPAVALLIAGWAIWRKNHIYYIEKENSYLLAYSKRLIAEYELIKCSPELSEFESSKRADIGDLLRLMNVLAEANARTLATIARRIEKRESKMQKREFRKLTRRWR